MNLPQRDSFTTIERIIKITKESAAVIGVVVTLTLIYSNINNSIESLKQADTQRKEDIKHLQESQQGLADTLSHKLDEIAQKQSDQLLQITKLTTQFESRTSIPSQFRRGQ